MTAMVIIQGTVAGLFVCYAEDPEVLARTKPKDYDRITNPAKQRYGDRVAMFNGKRPI